MTQLDDLLRPLEQQPAADVRPWPTELLERVAVLERKANLALLLLALIVAGVVALLLR